MPRHPCNKTQYQQNLHEPQSCYDSRQPYQRGHGLNELHPMRHQPPAYHGTLTPYGEVDNRPHPTALLARPVGVPHDHGMGSAHCMRVPSVLPSAEEAVQGRHAQEATAPAGCDAPAGTDPRQHAPARFAHTGTDVCSTEDAWQQLLEKFRSAEPTAASDGGLSAASDASPRLVELQPAHGILCAQDDSQAGKESGPLVKSGIADLRPFFKHQWVVNPCDWIDVEHVLRKMLRCDSSDCHHFHSIGYIFFRSCAMSHITNPSDYLQPATQHRFHGT